MAVNIYELTIQGLLDEILWYVCRYIVLYHWIFGGNYGYHADRFLFINGKENMCILHFISKMVVHAHLIVYSKMTYMSTQLSFPLCPWFYACPYRHINCRQMLQKGTKRLHHKITRGFQWGICNDLLLVPLRFHEVES